MVVSQELWCVEDYFLLDSQQETIYDVITLNEDGGVAGKPASFYFDFQISNTPINLGLRKEHSRVTIILIIHNLYLKLKAKRPH